MGQVLGNLLRSELGGLNFVGDIRGRGLFWAVEFMQDPQTRTPFPIDAMFCNKVVHVALDLGLNILGNLGQTGAVHIEHVIMSPPYIVTSPELRRMVAILRTAIETVIPEFQTGPKQHSQATTGSTQEARHHL